jgi:hypothetical protein
MGLINDHRKNSILPRANLYVSKNPIQMLGQLSSGNVCLVVTYQCVLMEKNSLQRTLL